MIPGLADAATEMFHWQRYLYFRPWYEDKNVIDAASGEGYGGNYASVFAKSVNGFDIDPETVAYATQRYRHVKFNQADVCAVDYSKADLVTSFETIEHLPDPVAFLKALDSCKGTIVISTPNRETHSPGNTIKDKPFNEHHTIEWTPKEFAKLIKDNFKNRQIRFLSQAARWPGTISEGLRDDAMYTIAVIGDGQLPQWPRLGISMPTRNADRAIEAAVNLSKYYPGEIQFAIVANGCSNVDNAKLTGFSEGAPHLMQIVESPTNLGYGAGANLGLDVLWQDGWFDLFGVVNDDVYPAVDCICQMVCAFANLEGAGKKPGIIGPVSNYVNGAQQVDIGLYQDVPTMQMRAAEFHRRNHSAATEATQVRGLFILISPDCLSAVGGFDPRFGIGNFEDDDHNLRCRLAGYTLWIADGAFLHHTGSATFKELNIDYTLNVERNMTLILEKWSTNDFEKLITNPTRPQDLPLFQSLTGKSESSGFTARINGEPVDLVYQATDMEFAAFVMQALQDKPRKSRELLLRLLQDNSAA